MKILSIIVRVFIVMLFAFALNYCSITSHKLYDQSTLSLKNKYADLIDQKEYVLSKKYHYIKTADSSGTAYIRIFNPDLRQINSLETFQSKSCKLREGQAWYWYDNGVLREEGQYANDNRHGKWKEYYFPGGALKAEGYYKNGMKVGQWVNYDPNGRRTLTITYAPDNPQRRYTKFDSSGQIVHEGQFHEDNAYLQMFNSPNSSYLDEFDVLPCFAKCTNEQGVSARFSCTNKNLLLYIHSNIQYPAKARYHSIMGTALFRCTIAKDGSIRNVRALVGICKEIEEECIGLLQNMPAWKPALNDGVAVEVQMTLPIQFELQDGGVYSISAN